MWETIELRELRIFLTLAEELHFARTAERLHLSQSRVSQAIRTLETKTGGPLFERTSRHVALTPLGERMHAEVGPAYGRLREAFEDTRERAAGITGTLRIGLYTPLSAGRHMVEIVRAFTVRYPACEVVFVNTGLNENPLSWVRTGRVDLLATRLPITQPDIAIGPVLSRERRVLLISRDDPLAEREEIAYEDIGDRPVSDLPSFPREMMDAYIPPTTASGRPPATHRQPHHRGGNDARRGRRAGPPHGRRLARSSRPPRSHRRPHQRPTTIRDRARLGRRSAQPRVSAFVSTARDVLADTGLADDT